MAGAEKVNLSDLGVRFNLKQYDLFGILITYDALA